MVGIVALSAPDSGPTRCATIALATIATDTNSEYRPALRVATYLQPKDSIAVNGRIRHPGIMPLPDAAAHDDRTDDLRLRRDDVAPPTAEIQETTFSDDCRQTILVSRLGKGRTPLFFAPRSVF